MKATGGGLFDVAVVGLGPAGRALASRCAAAGLTVLALDPRPDAPWHQTLSVWADQVPPWLRPEACGIDVLAHRVSSPALYAPGRAVLQREYAVLDNDALRRALPLGSGVTVEREAVDDAGLRDLTARAHRVVDCRGAGGRLNQGPLQTAYGIVVDAADAAPALGGEAALFMDWRTDYARGRGDDDEVGPSFLYAIPLSADRVLLEETCLAGLPAPDPAVLASRLRSRLAGRGVPSAAIDDPLSVERVHIPLLPRPGGSGNPLVEAFGTAGGHGHAATGYSVAAMLAAVPAAVLALGAGHPLPAPRSPLSTTLHGVGLRALLRADDRTLRALFAAFGRLDGCRQRWFLDGASPSHQVAAAMWDMWVTMPVRDKAGMVAAVLRRSARGPAALSGVARSKPVERE
ncbi:lycopene cyclase family protein [Dietzia cinnamea]|uniref:Lycopene cyclase family protein n=1 Tax=Dietzia cinnamea TaxID=321318 RepID=A0ABV3YKK4_9ACTN|nr:lycopene cyclase family protein [Dietzia cinnamea]MCT1884380.1 lycopene cyclase family protein [Dietzia cinnamea]MCT2275393.1 lycopene cyclase family protein [Dietzia cinnamea]